ncbi:inter-alpha-trypsin inhibitor heavy chain H4-like isoform X2 [Diabrotica virgifera virgifera]|uniref:Inter-alpha-trypsin inhibitor heavy chain H4-like n=1 Tax=Diabrotica virgifera virgifera TaxID=50390 RepID=A0ABM5KUC6_DIAVI|nr:inter-alpha-trypsin inhibitor heavy chain H4-like isoform X2 [Diabrotica virgifera virgifera]
MKGILLALVASIWLTWVVCIPYVAVKGVISAKWVVFQGPSGPKALSVYPLTYQFNIRSDISNRYAKTLVTSKVENAAPNSNEATFTVVLPEKAFISKFVMEIDGKSYQAYVKEKEEAKSIYDSAVKKGLSAGHVAVSARDSNKFTVSINVEPQSKASFQLTYEELLERKNNQYELVLNIHPGQIVRDMNIEVVLNESRPLKFVKTPSLRSGNEISKDDSKLDPSADIQIINNRSAVVKFKPNSDKQREFAKGLGKKEYEGIAGQFVVQYDIERDPHKGEILLKDGYFVHFFAPEDVEPLSKHVVFILDTSISMNGRKLKQLKEAMGNILDQLKKADAFHIVEFNSDIFVWNMNTESKLTVDINNERDPFGELASLNLPYAVSATTGAITKGKAVISKLQGNGMTNMLASIETGLYLVNQELKRASRRQPLIIFLTDGDPTMGMTNTEEIIKIVTNINENKDYIPIYSLSFGDKADKKFLRKLSLKNLGFSRHIYEGPDAHIQLQNFYNDISSPLLSDIEFEYTDDVTEVSKLKFPIYFKGSELVVAGKYPMNEAFDTSKWKVKSKGKRGEISLQPVREAAVGELERLWAYLTIKHKLEQRELVKNKKQQLTKEALDLAKKYSFVTDVSSLVVVKPNETCTVNTEDSSKPNEPKVILPDILSVKPMEAPAEHYADNSFYPASYPTRADGEPYVGRSYTASYSRLLWLKDALNPNGTLNILGGAYDLGTDPTIPGNGQCRPTPNRNIRGGFCSLLINCPQVHSYLTSFMTYEQYACILNNKYAGVCCPIR